MGMHGVYLDELDTLVNIETDRNGNKIVSLEIAAALLRQFGTQTTIIDYEPVTDE